MTDAEILQIATRNGTPLRQWECHDVLCFARALIEESARSTIAAPAQEPAVWANEGTLKVIAKFGSGSVYLSRDREDDQTVALYRAPASTAAPVVPEGWKMVPIQPTQEMVKAAQFHTEHDDDEERGDPKNYRAKGQALAVYHEMLSAAPKPDA